MESGVSRCYTHSLKYNNKKFIEKFLPIFPFEVITLKKSGIKLKIFFKINFKTEFNSSPRRNDFFYLMFGIRNGVSEKYKIDYLSFNGEKQFMEIFKEKSRLFLYKINEIFLLSEIENDVPIKENIFLLSI